METKLFQQTNVDHILFLYKSVFVRVGLSSNKWTHGLMLDFGDFYDNSRLNKILAKIQKMDL